jgi:four helix bundle protein
VISDFGFRIVHCAEGGLVDPEELKGRTKKFGLDVIRLLQLMPRSDVSQILGRQLVRCATSVAANYRAACRARSKIEFLAKLGSVEEEADESIFWLEMIMDSNLLPVDRVKDLLREGEELLRIIVASIRTAKRRKQ